MVCTLISNYAKFEQRLAEDYTSAKQIIAKLIFVSRRLIFDLHMDKDFCSGTNFEKTISEAFKIGKRICSPAAVE